MTSKVIILYYTHYILAYIIGMCCRPIVQAFEGQRIVSVMKDQPHPTPTKPIICVCVYKLYYVFVVLGIEPKALCLAGKHSVTELYSSVQGLDFKSFPLRLEALHHPCSYIIISIHL